MDGQSYVRPNLFLTHVCNSVVLFPPNMRFGSLSLYLIHLPFSGRRFMGPFTGSEGLRRLPPPSPPSQSPDNDATSMAHLIEGEPANFEVHFLHSADPRHGFCVMSTNPLVYYEFRTPVGFLSTHTIVSDASGATLVIFNWFGPSALGTMTFLGPPAREAHMAELVMPIRSFPEAVSQTPTTRGTSRRKQLCYTLLQLLARVALTPCATRTICEPLARFPGGFSRMTWPTPDHARAFIFVENFSFILDS
ncbi:hypothetical protein F5148DRAFT_356561 [Russula earlei]|uniref:Uncharacterized protein n=1 Tax=Russula earlei TaxID=71964 RepID=A0ACC0UJT7_9AGAM|nr:hypothetical protein F5148DRAFT_356561 [Russula earlei]